MSEPLFVRTAPAATVRSFPVWNTPSELLGPLTLATMELTVVLMLEFPTALSVSALPVTRPVPVVPPARVRATFAVPALMLPVRTSDPPPLVVIEIWPFVVFTLPEPIVRLSASVTVSVELGPVMLALSVPIAVLSADVLLAVTLSVPAVIRPVALTNPPVALRVAVAEPMLIGPETVRLFGVATSSVSEPLFVRTAPAATVRSFPVWNTLSDGFVPAILATSELMRVFRTVVFCAATFSTLPVT